MTRLDEFHRVVKNVCEERRMVYGDPRVGFDRIQRLKAVVAECKDPLAREALEGICMKMARLIETPSHLDSWADIAGYAKTGVMVTDKG